MWPDIAAEVPNYKSQLKGQRILCPCDWDASHQEKIFYKKGGVKKYQYGGGSGLGLNTG